MKHYNSDSYFAKRAPRYQTALLTLPTARTLDLLPYCAVIMALQLQNKSPLRIADAFGGTGFLARSLSAGRFDFVVCDCCQQMLSGAAGIPNTRLHETQDDFQNVLGSFGNDYFDLVFSHGGLHHVVDMNNGGNNGSPNDAASRLRQTQIAQRLARMVRPGGALVIADIPENTPVGLNGAVMDTVLSETTLGTFLGHETINFIAPVLGLSISSNLSLNRICDLIKERLFTPVSFPVPRHYFDQYVACKTTIGHVAVYPDFDEIHKVMLAEGLSSLGRINYIGPWLFKSENEAGWFFKEKFSVGKSNPLGIDVKSEMEMFEVLRRFLGTRTYKGYVAVNWGITYAAYVRS